MNLGRSGPLFTRRSVNRFASPWSTGSSLGDASPSDLAESLDLGTNLLAHHLKVLEAAGVIRRVRSEGDRRRSYVQLRLDNPIVRPPCPVSRPTARRIE